MLQSGLKQMDFMFSGAFLEMHKPEVTEELSVGGSVQPILGCAIHEVVKLGYKLESLVEHEIY